MRKLKLLSLLMLICFSVGNVWATEVDVDLSAGTFANGAITWKAASNNITITQTKAASTTNVNSSYVSAPRIYKGQILSFEASGTCKITQIDIVYNGTNKGGTLTAGVEISENTVTDNTSAVSRTLGTASGGTHTFSAVDEGGLSAIYIQNPADASAQLRPTTITITYAGGSTKTLSSIAISGDPTKTSYYAGQDFDPAGLVVTGTYSDQSQSTITSGITWSFSPAQALELGQPSIGVTATVDNISSEEYNVDVTVTEAPAADNYEKVTAAPNDWSGEYLLVYEDGTTAHVWTGVDAANCYAAATISNDVIAKPEGAATLTIAPVEAGGYSLLINGGANDGKYLTDNANNAALKFATAAYGATLSYETDWTKILFSQRCIRFNNGTNSGMRFRYYADNAQQPVQLYKKVDGIVKPAAGLAYDAADAQKLVKVGGSLVAPTLANPNNLEVSYASSDEAVAEVASDGSITIKAAGKAVITASSAETETYKAGSASYTIFVATEAGTADDPLTEASAKNLIDGGCTLTVHVHGIVSGAQSANFSVNLTGGFQFYKLKDLGNVDFETAYLKAGDEITAIGKLKKYGSTYELDEGCYLTDYVEYTAPKQHIANDIANPYTIAQAQAYAADPVANDLNDFVYVRGVVTNVSGFSSTNGTLNIFVKDEGQDNSFEFYKCAGLLNVASNNVEPFESADDVREGDIVIGYGQLLYYNKTTFELKQDNKLVDLNRPEVAVEAVEMEENAEVEVGSTVTLHATILPGNATNQEINWTVQSGSDKASVADGVVTGIEEGPAVIRAASAADATKYAECTVTVVAADPTKHVVTFDATVDKTTEATELSITKGDLTIAVTEGDGRFNNGTDYRPYKNAVFTVSCSSGNITKIEFTCTSSKPITGFADLEGLDKANEVWTGNAPSVSFTASGAQVQMTQLVITYKEDNRAASGLAWSTDAVELTVGDEFTAPTLSNPNNISASAITIESSNTDLAVVNDGVVSLVADATGEATITATFAGNDDYKPATVSYTITVNAASPVLTDYYEKVTSTDNIAEGTYLIVYEEGSLAFNGGLTTLDAESNTIDVTITNDHKIGVTNETAAATFYIDPAAGTVKSASGNFIGVGSWSNGLKQDKEYAHNVLEIDGDGNAQIGIYNADWNTTGGTMRLQYNKSAGQTRFRYYKNGGQQSIALYKLANEVIKPEAGLAWNPAEDITLTVGDAFTAPTLLNPNSIDAAEITITSSNEAVATVTNGVVELVAEATGSTTITASFAGNASYKPATVSYKIKVNPANSIYVSSLKVNFGSVAKDATIENQKVTVTLTNVAAATAALSGSGASAFSIDKAALTESGDITISASSATAGEFSATLTISDDAGLATAKEVKLSLTVVDGEAEETPISTSSKWVPATEIADGMQVLITGVKDAVVYAMGEQKSTNRAAYAATVDGEGVLTPGEGTMAFTLVAQGDGTYAIRTSNGKYLYAAASGSNHLKTQDNVDENAKWTLTVSSAVAEGSSNRNIMRFNGSGTNMLFSCYSSGQTEIQFYVPQGTTPSGTDVRTGLTAGNYYTICYPKEMSNVQGASLWSFIGKDADFAYLVKEDGPFEAGKPFILFATASTVTADLGEEVVTEAGSNNGLYGTFSYMDAGALSAAGADYMLYKNALHPIGTNNHLDANRAYVILNNIQGGTPGQMPGRQIRRMPMQPAVATGFENVEASENPMKIMINGQMYILRGEKLYDATGRLVK